MLYCMHVQALELCQANCNRAAEQVALLNLGTTCELMGNSDKAIEWHTLVSAILFIDVFT